MSTAAEPSPALGVPAADLSDEDLARQGTHAHATRNWVFLHGTAEQFRRHTERMLELEQEYLRRHPKRTWQGSGGSETSAAEVDLAGLDVLAQVRHMTRTHAAAVEQLLARHARSGEPVSPPEVADAPTPAELECDLLRRFAAAPDGRLHKLEAHQAAREIGVDRASVAALFKAQPPLLVTAGEYRQITDAGRTRADR